MGKLKADDAVFDRVDLHGSTCWFTRQRLRHVGPNTLRILEVDHLASAAGYITISVRLLHATVTFSYTSTSPVSATNAATYCTSTI